jgi:methionyl-tRNA synthetase
VREGLGDWDISRDAPYFGIEDSVMRRVHIFYVPLMRRSATWLLEKPADRRGEKLRLPHGRPGVEQYHTSSARTS